MEEKILTLSDPKFGNGVFKAFSLSFARCIAENSDILLALDYFDKSANNVWKKLYDDFQDPEIFARYKENVEKDIRSVDLSESEKVFIKWAEFGWIVDSSIMSVDKWDNCPDSQKDADDYVLKQFGKYQLYEFLETAKEKCGNNRIFLEAFECFERRLYTACASLLVSLIDGALIKHKENQEKGNLRTGALASNRAVQALSEEGEYSLPGLFRFELFGFKTFIDLLFERANNFKNEPNRVNRNFLQHGMSKRKVLRKDCIKLFIAYKNALFLLK